MKDKPIHDPLVRSGFLVILVGAVLSVIFSSGGRIGSGSPLEWLGFALMLVGLVLIMYPLWKRRQQERRDKTRNY
jgi:hypothetical protein